jgi:hypothetical protein
MDQPKLSGDMKNPEIDPENPPINEHGNVDVNSPEGESSAPREPRQQPLNGGDPSRKETPAAVSTNSEASADPVEGQQQSTSIGMGSPDSGSPIRRVASDDAGFLEDDDESETAEVFRDEPEGVSAKKNRRARGKGIFSGALARKKSSKSYWSSDEDNYDSIQDQPQGLVAARSKAPQSNTAVMDPGASTTATPSRSSGTTRAKKPRSKRRARRASAADQEDASGSSSLEEPATLQTARITPPGLNASNSSLHIDEKPSASPAGRSSKAQQQSSSKPYLKSSSSSNLNRSNKSNGLHNNSNSSLHTSGTAGSSHPQKSTATAPAKKKKNLHLSIEDMEICQRLDDEYENALEEREIGYMARYTSVRQSACFSVAFMLIFLSVGTTFFVRYSDWSVHDSLLFSIYTITTVGYGNHAIPNTPGFQLYTILYIFVGIATLTIMVCKGYFIFTADR